MSSLSGGTKEVFTSYIKLIIYQSQLCENSLNIKNLFPYGISIQFDNNPETLIEPIKNINEIFNSSQNDFKYFITNKNQKHLIKINCYTKSIFIIKKKIASVKIAVNTNNTNAKNDKEKRVKKWYYLKNKNGEVIIKLLLSIDILNISNILGNDNNKIYLQNNENDLDNNISINKPNNINVHFNSISNNNLNGNGIGSTTYMTSSHYISSSNNSLKSSSTRTNNSNLSNQIISNQSNNLNNRTNISNNNNLLSSIIEKDDSMTINENDNNEIFGEINTGLVNYLQNLIKKNNQKLFVRTKNLIHKKQLFGKEENNFFKSKKILDEKNNKLKNNIKILDTQRQIYENSFIDLTENYREYEKNIYKLDIENDLNAYEKDFILNINNMYINQNNLDEMILEEKMAQINFGQNVMNKNLNLKDNEKSVINNYYNSKGYSFESNNYKNSLCLYGNGGNSNKILFNLMLDNKSIYYNSNNNHFNIKPSPISFKFKEIDKELNVSMSNSKGNSYSSEKNKSNKKRLITDYSKSTLNILDDLYIFDDIPDIIRNKASKSNNIVQNNLALNIDEPEIKKNKYKDNQKNKKVLQNNNKKNNYNNLISNRKKKLKIKINDDNKNNSYYRLENKYYTITTPTINKKSKITKMIPKNGKNKKDICIKDIDLKKSYEKSLNPQNNTINKNSYKSIIFKQNNNTINSAINNEIKIKNCKTILHNAIKNDNKNNILHENINNKKNNRVLKNVFTSNNKNNKKEKITSIITDNNKSITESLLGINSILPDKLISVDNNSRNVKYIQFNTNPNLNKNIYKKINRNCINLQKKAEINKENNIINYFCYNNESNTKSKNAQKTSFYVNVDQKKNTTDSTCSTKIISKKNTNFGANDKISKTIYYNLIHKKTKHKISNNKNNNSFNSKNIIISNKTIQNKKNETKKITNSKITFYLRKNKTINDINDNIKTKKKLTNNNRNNEYGINTVKNNKKINKIKFGNNHNYCLNNNTHLKLLVNSNKNKNSFLSLFNNQYN